MKTIFTVLKIISYLVAAVVVYIFAYTSEWFGKENTPEHDKHAPVDYEPNEIIF